MDRLNIVVICLDTFRADIVGPDKKLSSIETPALDALAAESVRFNRCFTEPGQTIQVRNGCFTGRRGFPYAHGYYGWHEIPDEYPTIAEILLEQGYATGLIADTPHLFKPNMNQHRGFMTWEHIRGAGGDGWRTGSWDLIREPFKDYFGAYEPAVPEASAKSLSARAHSSSTCTMSATAARRPTGKAPRFLRRRVAGCATTPGTHRFSCGSTVSSRTRCSILRSPMCSATTAPGKGRFISSLGTSCTRRSRRTCRARIWT